MSEELDISGIAVIGKEDLVVDKISQLMWRTKEGQYIKLGNIADQHLRDIALILMGIGFQKYHAPDNLKVLWLTALRME